MSDDADDKNDADKPSIIRRELRAAREPFRLLLAAKRLRNAPRGEGGVMVIPGFSANDAVMAPLRSYLKRRGHVVWGWGLGINRGKPKETVPAVIEQVERRVANNGGRPIALVGWSMGGVFAREVARSRPELVTQIITMATPIYRPDASEISQPLTVFYTQRDGVVDWKICIDHTNPNVENIEVDSSHLGIILDPTVWLKIAKDLAATPT